MRVILSAVAVIALLSPVLWAEEVPDAGVSAGIEIPGGEPVEKKTETKSPEKKWHDNLKLLGDFRYRYEMLKDEGSDERNRHRIRARVGFLYRVIEEMDLGFRIASSFDDPVSTNETLDNAFSGKSLRLDMAYFDYHPSFAKCLRLKGGKFENPFYTPLKSELVWDSDFTPEGMSLLYVRDFSDFNLYTNFSGFFVEERSAAKDSWLFGMQTGGKYKFMDGNMHLGAGIGFYYFTNLKNRPTLYDDTDSFGNSVNPATNYAFDYHELEFWAEAGVKAWGIPVALAGDIVKNVAKNVPDDMGWLVGFSVGEAKNPMTGAFRYNYRDIESDAVVGLLTDSDFRGGGTDGKGHELGADFAIWKHVVLGATYFYNQKGVNAGTDFHRFQLDLQLKI